MFDKNLNKALILMLHDKELPLDLIAELQSDGYSMHDIEAIYDEEMMGNKLAQTFDGGNANG